MATIEERIENIEDRLNEINTNFISLQDLILYITSINETMIKADKKEKIIGKITINTNKRIMQFRDHIPPTCKISNVCATRLEKATTNILQIYITEGRTAALKSIKTYLEEAKKSQKGPMNADNICDQACLNNMVYILNKLKEFIDTPEYHNFRDDMLSDLSSSDIWIEKYDITDLYNLITPLSNIARLSILRILAKGSKSYSQLERECNIKANLNFHLEKLIKAKYILKENRHDKIKYSIHIHGLQALKLLTELKSKIL